MAELDERQGVSLGELCELFERLHEGVFFWDRDLKLIACNAFGCRLYGLDPEFMVPGRDYMDMAAALPPGRFAREIPAVRWQSVQASEVRDLVLEDFHRGVTFEIRFAGAHPRVLIGARSRFREGILASVVTDVSEREEIARQAERERSYLLTIIDNLEEGVALVDEDDRLVACNQGLTSLYDLGPAAVEPGASLERVIRGIGRVERLPAAVRERSVARALAWANESTPGTARIADELSDGRTIEMSRIGLPDGRRVFVARDATERVELARQRAELAAIVDNTTEGALLLDRRGRLVAHNAQFLEHYRVPPGTVRAGDHMSRVVALERDLDGLPLEEQARRRAERLEFALRPHEGRAEIRRELGTGRVLSVTRTPLEGGILFTYRDVTAEDERQRLLERAREAAEKASRMQSEFLARMSHELRTPMQGVLGMAALLEHTELDPQQRQYLDVIRASGRHMLELIEDLLTLSAMEAEGLSLHPRPVPLASALSEAIGIVRPQAEERGLSLDFDGRPVAETFVEMDATRVRQIVINLLGNAVRYTRAGGVTLRASARPAGTAGRLSVEVAVSDTGPGIPEAEQESVFHPFRQLDLDSGHVKEGIGLGLPVSRSLARMMGGDVTVQSAPGGGSTFFLRLDLPEARAPA